MSLQASTWFQPVELQTGPIQFWNWIEPDFAHELERISENEMIFVFLFPFLLFTYLIFFFGCWRFFLLICSLILLISCMAWYVVSWWCRLLLHPLTWWAVLTAYPIPLFLPALPWFRLLPALTRIDAPCSYRWGFLFSCYYFSFWSPLLGGGGCF